MAKNRYVNTRFWDDSYITRLSPNEKLIFLYLLTNPLTNISGVYETSAKRASFDIGLSTKEINKTLEGFEKDGKIAREDDWIGITNFIRHQSLNPKVKLGIKNELEQAPAEILEKLPIDFDSLSVGFDPLSHFNSNSNINPNTNSNPNLSDFPKGNPSTSYPEDVRKGMKRLVRNMRMDR